MHLPTCTPLGRFALSFRLRNLHLLALLLLAVGAPTAAQQKPSTMRLPLLAPDGSAIEEGNAYVSISSPGRRQSFSRRLDASGGLHLDFVERDDITLQVEVVGRFGRGRLVGSLTVAVDREGRWRAGLDGRRLVAPIVALAGRVRTSDGAPVAGLVVAARPRRFYCATTDSEGRFRILMPAQPAGFDNLAVKLRCEDYYFDGATDGTLPVRYRDKDAEIVVHRVARMRFCAKGLPAETVMAHGCRLTCESAETGKPVQMLGRFRLSGERLLLPAGKWNLVFKRGADEVCRINNVLAEGGIENHDARLMEFDWRRLGNLVTVRVQDSRGRSSNACRVVWKRASSRTSFRPRDGMVRMLVEPTGAQLLVVPRRGDPVDLDFVTRDRLVKLR